MVMKELDLRWPSVLASVPDVCHALCQEGGPALGWNLQTLSLLLKQVTPLIKSLTYI